MSMPNLVSDAGDQPVWAVMRSVKVGTFDGVLGPTRIDVRPLLTHMPQRYMERTLTEYDAHYHLTTLDNTGWGKPFNLSGWLTDIVKNAGVNSHTVRTVVITTDDLAAVWEWVSANRWSDLLVYTYQAAPGTPDSVLDFRLGGFRPEVSGAVLDHWERAARWMRDLATALRATSRAKEDALTGLPLSGLSVHLRVYRAISDLAGHLVGPTPGGPFMDFPRARMYARAGITGTEARAYEFGPSQDRPSREVLATLAAFTALDGSS